MAFALHDEGIEMADGTVMPFAEFDAAYDYDGDDLGASYMPDATTFRLWAPTAVSVRLNLYEDSHRADAPLSRSLDLHRGTEEGEKGIWTLTVASDLKGWAYDFTLDFGSGRVNQSPDPYATAAVINGHRSVVLDEQSTQIGDFERMPAFSTRPTDAIIAELSVRDTTISPTSGVRPEWRGKYLGLTQHGTHNAAGSETGLDYIADLGVTHVQLMPIYDFGSVDESRPLTDDNYNWGYDPLNWNVPEGSFATDPSDPACRIREAKQMIRELHRSGLRVVMDVVYNHVYSLTSHPLALTVPGYFFRTKDGKLTSHSGCGNDFASERPMARKYILDSIRYWLTNFRLDGFRFDIMGLIDNETMRQVRALLDSVDPTMLAYGEGWDMNADLPKERMTIQSQAFRVDNREGRGTNTDSTVGYFNDSLRDALKGDSWKGLFSQRGFVSGAKGLERLVAYNLLGCQPTKDAEILQAHGNPVHYADASQLQQYAEIHDGMTLFDKIATSLGYGIEKVPDEGQEPKPDGEADFIEQLQKEQGAKFRNLTDERSVRNLSGADLDRVARMAKIADAAIVLAQGVPEIQLGQEFLRSKDGDGNSYNSSDTMNALDWDRQDHDIVRDSVTFVRSLFALRSRVASFRRSSFARINEHSSVLRADDGVVAWQVWDNIATFTVILNAHDAWTPVPQLPEGVYGRIAVDSTIDEALLSDQPTDESPLLSHAAAAGKPIEESQAPVFDLSQAHPIAVKKDAFRVPPLSVTILSSAPQVSGR